MHVPVSLAPRTIIAVLVGVLLLWAAYIAVGAYLYNRNPWRVVLVMACMAAFVGSWLLLLWKKGRGNRG